MSAFVIAQADDWVGIYVDEVLIEEGHSVPLFAALKTALDTEVESVEEKWVNQQWIELNGSLPRDMSDVVWEGDEFDPPLYDGEDEEDYR